MRWNINQPHVVWYLDAEPDECNVISRELAVVFKNHSDDTWAAKCHGYVKNETGPGHESVLHTGFESREEAQRWAESVSRMRGYT